jgi:hypothetical protein
MTSPEVSCDKLDAVPLIDTPGIGEWLGIGEGEGVRLGIGVRVRQSARDVGCVS